MEAAPHRIRVPGIAVLAAVLGILLIAAAIATTRGGEATLVSTGGGPTLPGESMLGAQPTAADVRKAFADQGLRLYAADAIVLEPRFASVRSALVGMWQVAGPGGFRIAVFNRNIGALASHMMAYPIAGDDTTAASGRVYMEARSRGMRPLLHRIDAAVRELRRISAHR